MDAGGAKRDDAAAEDPADGIPADHRFCASVASIRGIGIRVVARHKRCRDAPAELADVAVRRGNVRIRRCARVAGRLCADPQHVPIAVEQGPRSAG